MALTGLNLSGVSNPESASMPDIISALIGKNLPEFDNITGQQFLKDLVAGSTSSADAARTAALSNATDAMKQAMDHAEKQQSMENEMTKAYLAKNRDKDGNLFTDASSDGSNKPGGSGDGTGDGNRPGGSGGNKPGGSGGQGGSSGGGKTADILINYYNGSSGVTTVQQNAPEKTKEKPNEDPTPANPTPANPKPTTNSNDSKKPNNTTNSGDKKESKDEGVS